MFSMTFFTCLEVDNLEGVKSASNSTGDDAAALKEELELAHDTITNLRQQLDKAGESFKLNENEFENMRKKLEESTNKLSETEEQLAEMEEQVTESTKHKERSTDINALHEQLAERENTLASLSNEINLLKEQLNEREAELSSIREEKNELESQESKLRKSLSEVKNDLEMLNSSTLELMEELEYSQGNQEEQKVEIESLRKVCLVKGDAKDEIINLKTIIGGKDFCSFKNVINVKVTISAVSAQTNAAFFFEEKMKNKTKEIRNTQNRIGK